MTDTGYKPVDLISCGTNTHEKLVFESIGLSGISTQLQALEGNLVNLFAIHGPKAQRGSLPWQHHLKALKVVKATI